MKKYQAGFTLIELMIAVAIVAVLASIAYPSYTQYVIKSNRAGAQAEMMGIASREQQFLLANRTYAAKGDSTTPNTLEGSGYTFPSTLSSKYTYDVTVGTGTVPSFLITFTATGSQTSDGNLTLNNEGVKTPVDKW